MQLSYSGTRQSRRLALITLVTTTLLLVAALLVVRTTRWDTLVFQESSPGAFSAGPFKSGDAFEQNLVVPVDHLSSLRIRVHTPEGAQTSPEAQLIFRLYAGDEIVRQGFAGIPNLTQTIRQVVWSFVPIATSANQEYRLQVVINKDIETSIYTMASLTDKWPGALISNGVPTANHIDLAIDPGRELSATQVLLGAASRTPIGAFGIVLPVVAGATAFAAGILANRHVPSTHPRLVSALLVGLAAAAIHASIALGTFGSTPLPGLVSIFWIWILVCLYAISRALWTALLVGLSSAVLHLAMTLSAFDETPSPELTSSFWLWLVIPILMLGILPWVVTSFAWLAHLSVPKISPVASSLNGGESSWSRVDIRLTDKWRDRGVSVAARLIWQTLRLLLTLVTVARLIVTGLRVYGKSVLIQLGLIAGATLKTLHRGARIAWAEWRLITVTVVSGMTVAGLMLLVMSGDEALHQTVQGLKEGRPPTGRFGFISRVQPETPLRIALIGWLTFGIATFSVKIGKWTRSFLSG